MHTQRGATVSLCMIVRNEAHQLADCLSPVAHLFAEVVIVDTGSHDATREVAERFATRVVEFPWCDDFSAARNAALRQATGDWIFWLDADDRLSPENAVRLGQLFAGLAHQPRAYAMDTVVHQAAGARERARLTTHVRLFPRHPAIGWRGRVHEQLRPGPESLGMETARSDVQIDHLGYEDAAVLHRKLRRNLRLLRMDFAVNPDDADTLLHLGCTCAQLGAIDEARQHLWNLVACEVLPSPRTRSVLTALCEVESEAGNYGDVVALTTRGLVLFPTDGYLSYLQGQALFQLGEYAAAQSVLTAIAEERSPAVAQHVATPADLRQRLAPLALGEVLRVQGALHQAKEVMQHVTSLYPDDPAAWYFLGSVCVDLGDDRGLAAALSRLGELPTGGTYAALLLATRHLVLQDFDAAEQTLDRLIAQAPHLPLGRQLRAEFLRRKGAPQAVQMQAYRDVLRVKPRDEQSLGMVRQFEGLPAKSAKPSLPSGAALAAEFSTSFVLGAGISLGT